MHPPAALCRGRCSQPPPPPGHGDRFGPTAWSRDWGSVGTGLPQPWGLPTALPAPLQPLCPPLTSGAALELKFGLLLLQDLQVGQQRLVDRPVMPPPPQQAEAERLSLQLLQHRPSLEKGLGKQRGRWGQESRRWGGRHTSPPCPLTCPL